MDAGWFIGIVGVVTAIGTAIGSILTIRHKNKLESDSTAITQWKEYGQHLKDHIDRRDKHIDEQDAVIGKLFASQMRQIVTLTEYYSFLERWRDWGNAVTAVFAAKGTTLPPSPGIPAKFDTDAKKEAEFLARQTAQVNELIRSKPPSNPAPPASAPTSGPGTAPADGAAPPT